MFDLRKTSLATAIALAFGLGTASAANIVETAAGAGQFDTLLAAKAAGLADDLAASGPLTVFAPTDAAFAKLPKGTVKNLLKPENRRTLRSILRYHVVPSRVAAKDVPNAPTEVKTLNRNDTLTVVRRNGEVRVDKARVVKADIEADNGIIHVIDRVLMPGTN